ncbi:hypothetical protein HDU67_007338 [Dinochytrium kinnereticum]|nr:hypothetical protein HDU67_007338 [Dinochytrium kinnereticum]
MRPGHHLRSFCPFWFWGPVGVWIVLCLVNSVHSQSLDLPPVYVGILHSQTGPQAAFELPLIQAELLAIEEINAAGGVLGRRVIPVIRDGASDIEAFVSEAKSLVANSSIVAVFGATPNQQIEPAIRFLVTNYVKIPFVLVGMDEPYSRVGLEFARVTLDAMGRAVVSENYLPLPTRNSTANRVANNIVLDRVIQSIRSGMPQGGIILSTVSGEANIDLFDRLNSGGFTSTKYPVMSFSLSERDVASIGLTRLMGNFLSANYLMTDPAATPSTEFDILSLRFIMNATEIVTDAMESSYTSLHLWAAAVDRALSLDNDMVRVAGYGAIVDAPQGAVTLQPSHHLAKYARIGRMAPSGRFELVFITAQAVDPNVWNQFLPSTRGLLCDHRRPNGERFSPPSVQAAVIYSSLMPATYEGYSIGLYIVNMLYGGVVGRMIIPTIINVDWPQEKLRSALHNMSTTTGIDVVFGTAFSAETWKTFNSTWSQLAETNNTLSNTLIYVLPPFMPPCQKNIIFSGISPIVSTPVGLSFFRNRRIEGAFFIGEEGDVISPIIEEKAQSLLNSSLPGTMLLGRCRIDNPNAPDCFTQLEKTIFSTPASSRLLIVNSIPPFSPNFNRIYEMVNVWISQRSQKITILSTSTLDDGNLTPNMTGHFSLGSYFQDIMTPENAVLKQNIWSRSGPRTVISESVEKAYSTVANIYNFGTSKAQSIDSEAVRINQWGTPSISGSSITIHKNNQLSGIVRLGQIVNVAGRIRYRVVLGDSPITRFQSAPKKGEGIEEGDQCYFGPTTAIPSSLDALRIIALVLTSIGVVFCVAGIAWVIYYRRMIVIRHIGINFLILTMLGCLINLIYVYILIPVEKTSAYCVAEFWPLHLGFILENSNDSVHSLSSLFVPVTEGLCDFPVNSKEKIFKGPKRRYKELLDTIFEGNILETFTKDIIPGVLVQKTWSCEHRIWEWAILGLELLMVIIGIALALQIRNVPSSFNESFELGMAIYTWAFLKVLTEVFLLFLPFDYQVNFALKAFGEIIPSLHSSITFLWTPYKAIAAGKGNELPRAVMTTFDSSSDSTISRYPTVKREGSDMETGGKVATIRIAEIEAESPTQEGVPFLAKSSPAGVTASSTLGRKLTSPRAMIRPQQQDSWRDSTNAQNSDSS